MTSFEVVSLYYQRQLINATSGRVETKIQTLEGVRQDVAQAQRMVEAGFKVSPAGAVDTALTDYPAA